MPIHIIKISLWVALTFLFIACSNAPAPQSGENAPFTGPANADSPQPQPAVKPETPKEEAVKPTGPAIVASNDKQPAPKTAQPASKARSIISGCLKSGKEEPAVGMPAGARGASPIMPTKQPGVKIRVAAGNVAVVEHYLAHACCLKGSVKTTVKGNIVQIDETLSGTACRCRCSSTIVTRVPLTEGTYHFKVDVINNDTRKNHYEETKEISTPR